MNPTADPDDIIESRLDAMKRNLEKLSYQLTINIDACTQLKQKHCDRKRKAEDAIKSEANKPKKTRLCQRHDSDIINRTLDAISDCFKKAQPHTYPPSSPGAAQDHTLELATDTSWRRKGTRDRALEKTATEILDPMHILDNVASAIGSRGAADLALYYLSIEITLQTQPNQTILRSIDVFDLETATPLIEEAVEHFSSEIKK